jgi:uncharacterized protein
MTTTLPARPGPNASTLEVWEYACAILRDGHCDEWAELLSEDVVLEWPFAGPGLPKRMTGRDEVKRLLTPVQKVAIGAIAERTNNDAEVHLSDDPEVLVAEIHADIRLKSGESFHNHLVHVVRVRGGEIVEFRDYFESKNAADGYSKSLEPLQE